MEAVKDPDTIRENHLIHMMELYEKDLLRMCSVYLRDRSLAEDAVQETFLNAYKGLDNFRGHSSEKTWLMRIAMNTCHTMRRNKWYRFVDLRFSPADLPAPADCTDYANVELAQEVMRLPSKHQEVILLYYYQGMKTKEIAEVLEISTPAVSKRLKIARSKLHLALEGGDENE